MVVERWRLSGALDASVELDADSDDWGTQIGECRTYGVHTKHSMA